MSRRLRFKQKAMEPGRESVWRLHAKRDERKRNDSWKKSLLGESSTQNPPQRLKAFNQFKPVLATDTPLSVGIKNPDVWHKDTILSVNRNSLVKQLVKHKVPPENPLPKLALGAAALLIGGYALNKGKAGIFKTAKSVRLDAGQQTRNPQALEPLVSNLTKTAKQPTSGVLARQGTNGLTQQAELALSPLVSNLPQTARQPSSVVWQGANGLTQQADLALSPLVSNLPQTVRQPSSVVLTRQRANTLTPKANLSLKPLVNQNLAVKGQLGKAVPVGLSPGQELVNAFNAARFTPDEQKTLKASIERITAHKNTLSGDGLASANPAMPVVSQHVASLVDTLAPGVKPTPAQMVKIQALLEQAIAKKSTAAPVLNAGQKGLNPAGAGQLTKSATNATLVMQINQMPDKTKLTQAIKQLLDAPLPKSLPDGSSTLATYDHKLAEMVETLVPGGLDRLRQANPGAIPVVLDKIKSVATKQIAHNNLALSQAKVALEHVNKRLLENYPPAFAQKATAQLKAQLDAGTLTPDTLKAFLLSLKPVQSTVSPLPQIAATAVKTAKLTPTQQALKALPPGADLPVASLRKTPLNTLLPKDLDSLANHPNPQKFAKLWEKANQRLNTLQQRLNVVQDKLADSKLNPALKLAYQKEQSALSWEMSQIQDGSNALWQIIAPIIYMTF